MDVSMPEIHKALLGEQSAQETLDAMAKGLAEFECVR
jgi:hypothetical protein